MANIVRLQSYPPVLGVELLEPASPADDAAPCEAASSLAPWTSARTPLGEFAQALRPGAARFTCNGGILQMISQPPAQQAPQSRFVRCDETLAMVAAPREQLQSQPETRAGPSSAAAAVGTMASPFSASACQLLYDGLGPAHRDGAELGPVPGASLWPLPAYGCEAACGTGLGSMELDHADGYMDWPASPARTSDGAAALIPSWFTPGSLLHENQHQDALLLARPTLTFSEHPCTLLRAQSGGRASSGVGTDVGAGSAAAHTASAAAAPPPPASCCVASSTPEPCEASSAGAAPQPPPAPAPSASVPALSCQASLDRNSGVQTGPHDTGVEQEAVSAACPPAVAAPAAPLRDSTAAAAAAAPASAPRQRLSAGLHSYGAQPPAPPAPVRSYKRRAAAAAAAAVVRVAAGEDGDDEDYDGSEDAGASAGGRGAKRMKKGGSGRQTAGKLVRGGVTCRNCGATQTPQWRCGPEGPRTLCNACGVRFKKGLPLAYMERKKRQMGL